MPEHAKESYLGSSGGPALWLALLGGPVAFQLHLVVNYMVVQGLCEREMEWPVHVVTVLALALCALAGWQGWRLRSQTGEHLVASGLSRLERTRFVANVGLLATGLFTTIILAQWIGFLILSPCDRI